MTAPKNRFGRTPLRLAAAVGAAALGAGAFALPAQAQAPVPTEVFVEDYSPVTVGGTPELFGLRIAFGDDFEEGAHTVTATVEIDAPDNTFVIGLPDGSGSDCPFNEANTVISCSTEEAEATSFWEFRYAPVLEAGPGTYDYTVTFAVDGETVTTVEENIEVTAHEDGGEWPYLHSDVDAYDVAPGDTPEFEPEFLQDQALMDDAAAVIVNLRGNEYLPHGLATPVADYDNCVTEEWGDVHCVVTDFEDLPGTVFTFSDPVGFKVSETAPGPTSVCGCVYEVFPVDADTLEAGYGGVFWDEGSDNLFGLRTVADPESEFDEPYSGNIDIDTAENPYDLAVSDVNVKGDKGTETTVIIPVTSEGPADAVSFFDGPGSYVLLGALPTGVDLVQIDDEDWSCIDPAEAEMFLPGEDLEGLDFACFFTELGAGETKNLPVRVKVTGTDPKSDGTLAVIALNDDSYPGVADADAKNDTAKFTVNAGGSGQLPTTGASLGLVIGGAVLVLIAGVLMFVLTRRRKATAGGEE